MLVWNVAVFTHRGLVRAANEDGVSVENRILMEDMAAPTVLTVANDSCVLMIADGLGGHDHGAVASRALLEHLLADIDRVASASTCAEAIQAGNDRLYELMHADPRNAGMGATLVGVALTSTQMLIFNAGDSRGYLHSRGHDSRGYLHSRGHLIQLSHDDVPDIRVDGLGRRISHAVSQAVGGSMFHIPVEPHVNVEPPLLRGEKLLLCSDGLTDMVPDQLIGHVLRQSTNIEAAARTLAAHAFRAGAGDNLSLVLAERAS